MKRILFFIFCLFAIQGYAQVQVTFAWDPSPDAATAPANNPVKYRLLQCSDQATSQCTVSDTGTTLEKVLPLTAGVYYVTARAYWSALDVDGQPSGETLESGNSNVLKVTVRVPPGNPKNAKVTVTQVAESTNGQTTTMKRHSD